MSQPVQFIVGAKETVPEAAWPWFFSALKQDAAVWEALSDPYLASRVLVQLADQPRAYSPAALAFLTLDYALPAAPGALPASIRQRGLQTYEALLRQRKEGNPDRPNLARAGQLAIALAEHHRMLGSWAELATDLSPVALDFWKTPLACLYGLVEDPVELLRQFIHREASPLELGTGLHILLSNPQAADEVEGLLLSLSEALPLRDQVNLLHLLENSHPSYTRNLAAFLAGRQATVTIEIERFRALGEMTTHIEKLLLQSEIYRLAGHYSQASAMQTLALQVLAHLTREVTQAQVETIAKNGDPAIALKTWQASPAAKFAPPQGLILALKNAETPFETEAIYENHSAAQQYAEALQSARAGELELARQSARSAARSLIDLFGQRKSLPASHQFDLDFARQLCSFLLDLELVGEAVDLSQTALQLAPHNPSLLALASQAFQASGNLEKAVESAQLASALLPDSTSLRMLAAEVLEASQAWDLAIKERHSLLEPRFLDDASSEQLQAERYCDLARCLIHASKYQQAAEACLQAITFDPNHGLAHTFYGQALAHLGDQTDAFNQLTQGTVLAPDQPYPWIALARTQKDSGQLAKVIDTLRSAANNVPGNSAIQYFLAEAYLQENSVTQALSALRLAYEYSDAEALQNLQSSAPKRSPYSITVSQDLIALRLGETLIRLGHFDEAAAVFGKTYEKNPNLPGLAFAYARGLIAMGNPEKALEPLATAVKNQPFDPNPHFDYGKILLEIIHRPAEAIAPLQRVLELQPAHGYALALLAEAYEAVHEDEKAVKTYYSALETELSSDDAWGGRLSFGLGRVALRLGQTDIALAALQDAARANHQDPKVQQALSDTYHAINLPKEALYAARLAIQLSPNNLDTLIWFALQAHKLGVTSEAVPVLSRALQLNPHRADLALHLGGLYETTGNLDFARSAYRHVLGLENPQTQDLITASHALRELGDAQGAIDCLEKTLQVLPNPSAGMLKSLAEAYALAGQPERSLHFYNRGIHLDPEWNALYLEKSNLLLSQGQAQDARQALYEGLTVLPDDALLHHAMSPVMRDLGDLAGALRHAKEMVRVTDNHPDFDLSLAACGLAAAISRAILDFDTARSFINHPHIPASADCDDPSEGAQTSHPYRPLALPYYCLVAEMALDEGEEVGAAEALAEAYNINPEHPRVNALQARLTIRRGDSLIAMQSLEQAIQSAGGKLKETDPKLQHKKPAATRKPTTDEWLAFAAATLELGQWESGLYLLRQSTLTAQGEPYPHHQLARALVNRAEYKQLCEALTVTKNLPSPTAMAENTLQAYQRALQQAQDALAGIGYTAPDQHPALRRWSARGKMVFGLEAGAEELLERLPQNPDDHAALIIHEYLADKFSPAALTYLEKLDSSAIKSFPVQLLASLALALGEKGRRQEDLLKAITAARAAADQQPANPLFHALLSRLLLKIEDLPQALQEVEIALSIWPNEPHWHSQAAQILTAQDQMVPAVIHLQQAVQADPANIALHMALGEAYLQNGDYGASVHAYDQAQRVAPKQVDPAVALAKVHLKFGELEQAASCVDRAITLAPNRSDLLMLNAEISLQAGDLRTAQNRTQAVLRIRPEDPAALHLMARVQQKLGRPREALTSLEKAIPLAMNPLSLLLLRVELVKNIHGVDAMMAELNLLATQYPQESLIHAALAGALMELGDADGAKLAAKRALEGQPSGLEKEKKAQLLNLLGRLMRKSGQLDQAIDYLREAVKIAPFEADTYLELGFAQQDNRQFNQALETFQKATSKVPSDPRPYYQAAMALKESRDYQAAETMLRKASELAPEDTAIHRQLAALIALNLVHSRRSMPIDL